MGESEVILRAHTADVQQIGRLLSIARDVDDREQFLLFTLIPASENDNRILSSTFPLYTSIIKLAVYNLCDVSAVNIY